MGVSPSTRGAESGGFAQFRKLDAAEGLSALRSRDANLGELAGGHVYLGTPGSAEGDDSLRRVELYAVDLNKFLRASTSDPDPLPALDCSLGKTDQSHVAVCNTHTRSPKR